MFSASLSDQSHLSHLPGRCVGCTPGGVARTVSISWVLNWKVAHSRVCPNISFPAAPPAPPLNKKQSRIVSGAPCTSAVLHRPTLMKSTAYSKDFFPTMCYLLLLFIGFQFCLVDLVVLFMNLISPRVEEVSSAAWVMVGWIPCAISSEIILQHDYLQRRCMFFFFFNPYFKFANAFVKVSLAVLNCRFY